MQSPHTPARRGRTTLRRRVALLLGPVLGALPGFLGLSSCAPQAHGDWPRTKQWIRDTFPAAPVVTVDALRAQLARPEAERPLLLDARTPEEFAVSHLPGARLTPTLDDALAALEDAPPERPVVVYCSVGYRSGALTEQLRAAGRGAVSNLEGSLFEWANRGFALEHDGHPVREAHPFDEEWGRLLRRELWAAGWQRPAAE